MMHRPINPKLLLLGGAFLFYLRSRPSGRVLPKVHLAIPTNGEDYYFPRENNFK
jgi:hypothetical protein